MQYFLVILKKVIAIHRKLNRSISWKFQHFVWAAPVAGRQLFHHYTQQSLVSKENV